MARFFQSIRRPVYRPRPRRPVGFTTAVSSSPLMHAEVGAFIVSNPGTNFGTQLGLFDNGQFVENAVATTINLDTKVGLATTAFTETGIGISFGWQVLLSTVAYTTATPSSNLNTKFGLNVTAFTLTGIDTSFITVSRRKTFGYIYR